jgi:hypothetical protein
MTAAQVALDSLLLKQPPAPKPWAIIPVPLTVDGSATWTLAFWEMKVVFPFWCPQQLAPL